MKKLKSTERGLVEDLVELARPFTLISPGIGFISGGLVALFAFPRIPLSFSTIWPILVGGGASVLLNACSNSVNQIYDLDIDIINKPNRPLASGRLSIRKAALFAAILFVIILGLAFAVPNKQFFLIITLTSLIVYAYSGPPFRLKCIPFVSNAAIALTRGCLLIVAGWTAVRSFNSLEPWFLGFILGSYVFGACSTKDFSDMKGDGEHECETLPLKYGVEKSVRIIAPFFILPFLLLPHGIVLGILSAQPTALGILSLICALWGSYTVWLLFTQQDRLTIESNHVSWKHMYILLILAQAGLAICYIMA